jgi:hypothetical protein
MDIRAAGEKTVFAFDGDRLLLGDENDALFELASIEDRQISLLRSKDIGFASFDASGRVLCLVSKSGLVVFIETHAGERTKGFLKERESEEKGEKGEKGEKSEKGEKGIFKTLPLWWQTLRIVWNDGRIVPFRAAIEDQFRFNVKSCLVSADSMILVPFQIVFDTAFAVLRVQPPESCSCLVRVAYRVDDDANPKLHTRQALMNADWLFIYEMGIIDIKIRSGVVLILTHTCIVELFLADHDPMPIAMSLPRDKIDVLFSDAYIQFCNQYRLYCYTLSKLNTERDVKAVDSQLVSDMLLYPPEWAVVFRGQNVKSELVMSLVQLQETIRPRLKRALREEMQVVMEPEAIIEKEEKVEIAEHAVPEFGDTKPSYACPWLELAATDTSLYLNTFNGVYMCKEEWVPLISVKTGRSVFAVNLFASAKYLFVQEDEESPWRKFETSGRETVLHFKSPLLFAIDEKLMTGDHLYDDAVADSADTLSSCTERGDETCD